jgi:hypothetical protein
VACWIGQLLAATRDAGATVAGVDVVFAKLWLARHFIVPDAELWCVDVARQRLPVDDGQADLVVVHDALYFVPDDAGKRAVVAEAERVGRRVAIGHAHNALVDNWSAGRPLDPESWAALLPAAELFDDLELTAAWLGSRRPRSRPPGELAEAAAVALVGPGRRAAPPRRVGWPTPGRRLRLNPLLQMGCGDPAPLTLRWPSDRYRAEYAPISGYLDGATLSHDALARAAAGRLGDADVAELLRRRIVIDLPEHW